MQGQIGYLTRVDPAMTPNLTVFFGNILDAPFLRDVASGVDTIFHLAAVTSVAYAYTNPGETLLANIMGTYNLCTAARQVGVRRLIHTSSGGVYGSAVDGLPICETHPVRACNPYTASKLSADSVAETFYLSYDLPVTTCRIFNVYGPRMGKFLVIPTIGLQLLEGDEVKLGDVSPLRNFTYVEDIVAAFLRMAESEDVVGEIVNFGSPEAIAIKELAGQIGRLMGRQVRLVQDPQRFRPKKSEILVTTVDISKAKALLGWEPVIPLEDGLRRTINWMAAGGYNHPQVRPGLAR
jgi:dTDP-glucose 4,6-dehydratase